MYRGFWWWYLTKRYNSEYRRALIEALDFNPKARYVDLGCNTGEITSRCAIKIGTPDVYGFEMMPDHIKEARKRGIQCEWANLDVAFPAEDNSIDVLTANQLIEHIDETDTFIKEMLRVLKPGGYAVISTNNLAAFHWIVMFLLTIHPPTACISDEMDIYGPYKGERLHRRLFTLRGLEKVLRFHGFEIEKSVGTYWFPFPVWFARILCWLDKYHATCITVKVRKPENANI